MSRGLTGVNTAKSTLHLPISCPNNRDHLSGAGGCGCRSRPLADCWDWPTNAAPSRTDQNRPLDVRRPCNSTADLRQGRHLPILCPCTTQSGAGSPLKDHSRPHGQQTSLAVPPTFPAMQPAASARRAAPRARPARPLPRAGASTSGPGFLRCAPFSRSFRPTSPKA